MLFNISLRLREKVGKLNPFFSDPLNLVNIDLKMVLKRDGLPFHVNEVIFFKGLDEGLHRMSKSGLRSLRNGHPVLIFK